MIQINFLVDLLLINNISRNNAHHVTEVALFLPGKIDRTYDCCVKKKTPLILLLFSHYLLFSLSMQPFEHPLCTKDGIVFDLL